MWKHMWSMTTSHTHFLSEKKKEVERVCSDNITRIFNRVMKWVLALVSSLCFQAPESQDVVCVCKAQRKALHLITSQRGKGVPRGRNETAIKSTVTFNNMTSFLWVSICVCFCQISQANHKIKTSGVTVARAVHDSFGGKQKKLFCTNVWLGLITMRGEKETRSEPMSSGKTWLVIGFETLVYEWRRAVATMQRQGRLGRGVRGTSFMPLHTKLLGDVTSRKGIPGKGKDRGG